MENRYIITINGIGRKCQCGCNTFEEVLCYNQQGVLKYLAYECINCKFIQNFSHEELMGMKIKSIKSGHKAPQSVGIKHDKFNTLKLEDFSIFSDDDKLKFLEQKEKELDPIKMIPLLDSLLDKGVSKTFLGNTIDWGGHQVCCSLYAFLDWEFYIEHGLCI